MNDEEFKKQVLEQFGVMNKRLDTMDKRLDAMDKRFDTIEAKLGEHDARFEKIDKHLDRLEANLEDVGNDVRMVYEGLQAVLDQQEIEVKERAHITVVLNRHERWITGLGRHTKLSLSHD
jgi:archaellum component FlaC